jgi:hypothetical protein
LFTFFLFVSSSNTRISPAIGAKHQSLFCTLNYFNYRFFSLCVWVAENHCYHASTVLFNSSTPPPSIVHSLLLSGSGQQPSSVSDMASSETL